MNRGYYVWTIFYPKSYNKVSYDEFVRFWDGEHWRFAERGNVIEMNEEERDNRTVVWLTQPEGSHE